MVKEFKGSQKHILSLVKSPKLINSLIKDTKFRLAGMPHLVPTGDEKDGAKEMSLETYLDQYPLTDLNPIKKNWWVQKGKRPTWDLLAHLTGDQKSGILLVEAKANEAERKSFPKFNNYASDNQASIRKRFEETRIALFGLHRKRIHFDPESNSGHYQLINRLAYSFHLAGMGYHVILLYLGFLNDPDRNDKFLNDAHWQRAIGGCLEGTVSHRFPENVHRIGNAGGTLKMLIRSLDVSKLGAVK
tara:strand:- start:135 stop:869 length:735 start_codon:yes stop_codon:yes gene_type:complete